MVPGMIGRDYFKRQATTLRKLVTVATDPAVADRLSDMAHDFDERARAEDCALEVERHLADRGAEGHG